MTKKKHSRPRLSRMARLRYERQRGRQLTTPEGDPVTFILVRYRHAAQDEIYQILKNEADFGLGEDIELDQDGAYSFAWYEIRSAASTTREPIGRRILAQLTLAPMELIVETMSRRRADNCRQRLERLLGDRIQFVDVERKDLDQVLREPGPAQPEEPIELPPEALAEMEEKMLRQWIDASIPALDGMTPREAVETPEGRRKVLALLAHIEERQKRMPPAPGVFSPDYNKAKEMLGL
ncbi:MAG: DUF2384 domain-containing protein [Anaerolineae bacterium]|jgi:hypothetical protein